MGETYPQLLRHRWRGRYRACWLHRRTGRPPAKKFGMTYFSVTPDGKRALVGHMRASVDLPARYSITYRGWDGCRIVIAKEPVSGQICSISRGRHLR